MLTNDVALSSTKLRGLGKQCRLSPHNNAGIAKMCARVTHVLRNVAAQRLAHLYFLKMAHLHEMISNILQQQAGNISIMDESNGIFLIIIC